MKEPKKFTREWFAWHGSKGGLKTREIKRNKKVDKLSKKRKALIEQ